MSEDELRMLLEERAYLWRAIDLLVQEIGGRGDTSQWFRKGWAQLVREKTENAWAPPEGT